MFHLYGGRGIRMCERWSTSFIDFLADMGERPEGCTIDRFPNQDGDYEPGNCRWATTGEQSTNQRRNVRVTHEGVTRTLSEWADQLHVPRPTLYSRAAKGWGPAEILFGRPG